MKLPTAITAPQFFLQLVDDCFVCVCRFILENWVLDRWVRNILTVYPVVIVALVGNVWKHFNPADPTANSVFMGEFVMNGNNKCDLTNTRWRFFISHLWYMTPGRTDDVYGICLQL